MQTVLRATEDYRELDAYFQGLGISRLLLVCDRSLPFLRLAGYFDALEARLGVRVIRFDGFEPNPKYESVVRGVEVFRREDCQAIAAVGGGSAMDVAKCVKLYARMDPALLYLRQEIVPNDIPLLAIPTTAGTGSEATRFAVVYYEGEKQSIAHESCIPSAVLMDPSALRTLPDYQRRATMLDALCHAAESFWSVHSTEESRAYSARAVRMILENMPSYLANEDGGNGNMLLAANTAGKAINIAQTTAGHAMCYKLTSLYGIAHGHAAALCLTELWPYLVRNTGNCVDPRGRERLETALADLARVMGASSAMGGAEEFGRLYSSLGLETPVPREGDLELLTRSVNPVRLGNFPIALSSGEIERLYRRILNIQ